MSIFRTKLKTIRSPTFVCGDDEYKYKDVKIIIHKDYSMNYKKPKSMTEQSFIKIITDFDMLSDKEKETYKTHTGFEVVGESEKVLVQDRG